MKTILEYESLEEYIKDYPHASSWSESDWDLVRECDRKPKYQIDFTEGFSKESIELFIEEMFGPLK